MTWNERGEYKVLSWNVSNAYATSQNFKWYWSMENHIRMVILCIYVALQYIVLLVFSFDYTTNHQNSSNVYDCTYYILTMNCF